MSIGSVAVGRPLAGIFAGDVYAFPRPVRISALYRRTFGMVSLAWGGYMLLRSIMRFLVLMWSSVDLFVAVSVLTGVPCTLALMTWSFWYPLRAFRRQPELWSRIKILPDTQLVLCLVDRGDLGQRDLTPTSATDCDDHPITPDPTVAADL